MTRNPGPVGAPNARPWPTASELQAGDNVRLGDAWGRVLGAEASGNVVTLVVVVNPGARVHAVRSDRDRDGDGFRFCPVDGTRHDREGSYCSEGCRDEAMGRLLSTREQARAWAEGRAS